MNEFLKKLLILPLVVFTIGGISAQENSEEESDEEIEEIVVTGFRASIESSIASKKGSTSITEVVTAEDIGKLPDVSIAESIARLPGLTAQRLNGRGQVISVRGLSPDFTTALLNGREQVTAGNNRGVEFDQYPSELIQRVVIYKTPDAALIGGGLAGTADMQTVRPLSLKERKITINGHYIENDIGALNAGSEDTGERLSFSYIDQLSDTVGIAFGIATMQNPTQANRFNAWGYPNINSEGLPFGGTDTLLVGGLKPYVMSNNLERTGSVFILEMKPDDTTSHVFDVYSSDFEEDQLIRGIEFPLAWGWWPWPVYCCGTELQPGYTVENNLVTSGTFDKVKGVIRNDLNTRDSDVFAMGWNSQWEIGNGWTAEFDYSQTKVDRTDLILEVNFGTSNGGANGPFDTMSFVTGSTGTKFTSYQLDYADPNNVFLTSAQGWGNTGQPGSLREFGQVGYYNSPTTEDELDAIRQSFSKNISFGIFNRVEFGINATSRDKTYIVDEYFLAPKDGAKETAIPANLIVGSTKLDFLGITGGMLSVDPMAMLNSGLIIKEPNTDDDVAIKNWAIQEDVVTIYAMLDIDTELNGVPITGNFGVQYIDTEQSSNGIAITDDEQLSTTTSGSASYDDIFPSLNLIFDMDNQNYLRFAVAKTQARPRMDQMNATISFGYNDAAAGISDPERGPWSGGGGNVNLEPWTATQIDLSYEKYFGNSGYIALAYFVKDLDNYIYTQRELYDFSSFPVRNNIEPATRQGYVYTPQNGEGGEISGFEFTASVPLDMVSDALDGFGLVFTASQNDSEIEPNGPGSQSELPGLSEDIYNLTLYYEKNGVQARISDRYRSEFLGEVAGFGAGRDFTMVEEENIVDAQIGYNFEDGQFEGLSVFLQIQNLTDQEFVTFYNGDPRQVRDWQNYGKTFLLGFNYKL